MAHARRLVLPFMSASGRSAWWWTRSRHRRTLIRENEHRGARDAGRGARDAGYSVPGAPRAPHDFTYGYLTMQHPNDGHDNGHGEQDHVGHGEHGHVGHDGHSRVGDDEHST